MDEIDIEIIGNDDLQRLGEIIKTCRDNAPLNHSLSSSMTEVAIKNLNAFNASLSNSLSNLTKEAVLITNFNYAVSLTGTMLIDTSWYTAVNTTYSANLLRVLKQMQELAINDLNQLHETIGSISLIATNELIRLHMTPSLADCRSILGDISNPFAEIQNSHSDILNDSILLSEATDIIRQHYDQDNSWNRSFSTFSNLITIYVFFRSFVTPDTPQLLNEILNTFLLILKSIADILS